MTVLAFHILKAAVFYINRKRTWTKERLTLTKGETGFNKVELNAAGA